MEDVLRRRLNGKESAMDREELKKLLKEQTKQYLRREEAIRRWISRTLNRPLEDSLENAFQDGILLCDFLSKLKERAIPVVYRQKNNPLKLRENIYFFIYACEDLGIPRFLLPSVDDIFCQKNIIRVVECLEALGKILRDDDNYEGPLLERADNQIFFITTKDNKGKENLKKTKAILERRLSAAMASKKHPKRNGSGLSGQQYATSIIVTEDSSCVSSSSNGSVNEGRPKSLLGNGVVPSSSLSKVSSSASSSDNQDGKLSGARTPVLLEAPTETLEGIPSDSFRKRNRLSLVLAAILPSQTQAELKKSKYDNVLPPEDAPPPPAVPIEQNVVYEEVELIVFDEAKSEEVSPNLLEEVCITPQIEGCIIRIQACIRRRMAKNEYHKLLRAAAYRSNVASEIYHTEEVFVQSLNTVVSVFLNPLRAVVDTDREIISKDQIRSIFSDVEVILAYNSRLLAELKPRYESWGPHQCLGDIFLKIASFLKVYTQYVKDHNRRIDTLTTCKVNPKFAQFLADTSKKSEVGREMLSSFLIKPIQRIPRYLLLLGDLVKHTPVEHKDFKNLVTAASQIRDVAQYVDDRKKEAEAIWRVAELERSMVGLEFTLAKPHRRFVREGELFILPRKIQRTFLLFNDILVVCTPVVEIALPPPSMTKKTTLAGIAGLSKLIEPEEKPRPIKEEKEEIFLQYSEHYLLKTLRWKDGDNSESTHDYTFHFVSVEFGKETVLLTVSTNNEADKRKWKKAVDKAVEDYMTKHYAFEELKMNEAKKKAARVKSFMNNKYSSVEKQKSDSFVPDSSLKSEHSAHKHRWGFGKRRTSSVSGATAQIMVTTSESNVSDFDEQLLMMRDANEVPERANGFESPRGFATFSFSRGHTTHETIKRLWGSIRDRWKGDDSNDDESDPGKQNSDKARKSRRSSILSFFGSHEEKSEFLAASVSERSNPPSEVHEDGSEAQEPQSRKTKKEKFMALLRHWSRHDAPKDETKRHSKKEKK